MSAWDINKPIAVPEQVRVVMAMLRTAADAGAHCPSNDIIAERLGAKSMATGARIIALLETMGLITVERFNSGRVVTIASTGRSTERPYNTNPHWRSGQPRKARRPQAPRPSRAHLPLPEPETFPTVDRDPCPRCGTRGDIGCGHVRAPLGMGAFA